MSSGVGVDLLVVKSGVPSGLAPVALNGCSALSACFEYRLRLARGTAMLDPDSLLHKPVTIEVATDTGAGTVLNGLVREVQQTPTDAAEQGAGKGFWDYELVLVPALWFLSQTRDCRFYENKSSLDIVKSILGEMGVTDFKDRVSSPPPARPYTVMFNETYLDFIERLLARDGIFYFFEHSDQTHDLILADANSVFASLSCSPVAYTAGSRTEAPMLSWHRLDATSIGKAETGDYDPDHASQKISGSANTVLAASDASSRTHYAWPGFATDTGGAKTMMDRFMDASDVVASLYRGAAAIAGITVGGKFTLKDDPTKSGGGSYVAQSVSLSVSDGAGYGGGGGVQAEIVAFPSSVEFRPPFRPKPPMHGLYSATVIGDSGTEIYTDDMGRVKVRFPWDHRNEITPSGSFWLRVIQPWAGSKGWGAQFTPRVGDEVAVSFLEGDVDRPVVVGSLYNSANQAIFNTANKTRSGFLSRSSLKGESANANEFWFDDKKGSELVSLHAERDHSVTVEHDETGDIKHDQTFTIGNDRSTTVKNNDTRDIKNDQTLKVGNCRSVTVTKDETVKVDGKQSVTVMQAVTYESMDSITLKVGDNSIKIEQSGITLSGIQIKMTAQAMFQAKGAMTKLAGEAMTSITGGLVKIN